MRIKLLSALFTAGLLVGCASNPPPPPPVAEAPPPPPPAAPATVGNVDGLYKGMAELGPDAGPRCAKMTRTQTIRVRNNSFVLMGVKASVGPDGSVASASRRGVTVAGTVTPTGMDLNTSRGKCTYAYHMTKS